MHFLNPVLQTNRIWWKYIRINSSYMHILQQQQQRLETQTQLQGTLNVVSVGFLYCSVSMEDHDMASFPIQTETLGTIALSESMFKFYLFCWKCNLRSSWQLIWIGKTELRTNAPQLTAGPTYLLTMESGIVHGWYHPALVLGDTEPVEKGKGISSDLNYLMHESTH